jgi:hypothetical protein
MTGGEHLAAVGPLLRVYSFGTKRQRRYALALVAVAVCLVIALVVLAASN